MITRMPLVQCSIVVAAVRVEAIKWRDSAHPHTQGDDDDDDDKDDDDDDVDDDDDAEDDVDDKDSVHPHTHRERTLQFIYRTRRLVKVGNLYFRI